MGGEGGPHGPVVIGLSEGERDRIGFDLGEVIARFETEDYSLLAWHRCEDCRQPHEPCPCAGRNAAIPDLVDVVAALVDQARRECADELRADLAAATGSGWDLTERLHARANEWSGGGDGPNGG